MLTEMGESEKSGLTVFYSHIIFYIKSSAVSLAHILPF